MENVFKGKVSELPMEGQFYVTDISYFNALDVMYCVYSEFRSCDKYWSHDYKSNLISDSKFDIESYKQIRLAADYKDCLLNRFFNNRTVEVECLANYDRDYGKSKIGVQVMDCKTEGVVILQPNWSGIVAYVSEEMMAHVKELSGLCSNHTEAIIEIA